MPHPQKPVRGLSNALHIKQISTKIQLICHPAGASVFVKYWFSININIAGHESVGPGPDHHILASDAAIMVLTNVIPEQSSCRPVCAGQAGTASGPETEKLFDKITLDIGFQI